MTAAAVRRAAVVVVPPESDRRVITGLTLAERARRVVVAAGVERERVHLVRTAGELAGVRGALRDQPLLIVVAADQVVAAQLVGPLRLGEPGDRVAIDPGRGGEAAGAWVVDAGRADEALAALEAKLDGPGRALGLELEGCARVEVDRRARFPIREPGDLKAAIRWQFELVNKPLDAPICRYFYRPLARPLTILLLRTPLTPNVISVISIALSLAGCAIAASPDLTTHVVGLLVLLAGGIVDTNDGEVARLRLESSNAGAWLDAMGDDLARIGLVLGLGGHVAAVHPSWPVWPITLAAVAMTVTSLVLIYWYCIFVIASSNNQDYTKALQIGPGVRAEGQRTAGQWIADLGAQIVRRDFIDLGAVFVAAAGASAVTFGLLSVGSLVTLIVVIPTHLKIVKALRTGQLTRAV
ncbi:MAG: CDP-alcohol phosphatidyltransferase family protein [Kofleriaceae bacterium]